ncbi:MAG: hypothetical protein KBS68_01460, partial [Clostridiales bacterium]|nr:hypothetical protein [Candidatus Crickella merdequi]
YRINISNITAAKKSILSTAACVAIMAGALLSGIGSSGLALAGNVCAALGAFAQLGMSAAELKKCVTVTQIKKYY